VRVFAVSQKDLKNKFELFKKLNIGYYDGSLESSNASGHHFTFFGKKKYLVF
jgi:hypothetical protein